MTNTIEALNNFSADAGLVLSKYTKKHFKELEAIKQAIQNS